jgi:hypothetical protein
MWSSRLIVFIVIFTLLTGIAGEEISYHPLGEWRLVTSSFGYRTHPLSRSRKQDYHKGIDLAARVGDSVYTWRSGIVMYTGYNRLSGNMINLLHAGGYLSKYHHLSQILVKEGDLVNAGQLIGKSGRTGQVSGPHLHFSILKDNEHVDPYPFLKAAQPVTSPIIPAVMAAKSPDNVADTRKIYHYKEIFISSQPLPGKIYIDEEFYGATPLSIKLPYGEHFVEIDAGVEYDRFIGRLWINEDFNATYTVSLQGKNVPVEADPAAGIGPLPGIIDN